MIETEVIEVRARPEVGFKQNKTARGVLCHRVTHYRRGKKFVVWMPWTIAAMEDIFQCHGIDIESELARILSEEIVGEMGEIEPVEVWTEEDIITIREKAKALVEAIDWQ